MSAREVCLLGGSPWGFRMHGGCDQHQPLRISRVNPGSKAAQQGVREGDLISSINGRSTRELTNGEAHALLRNAGDQLKLGLNQENGSPKRRIYKSSLQENTSFETIKKTTTKTTTTNTQIISTEVKKNGTDDAKIEPSYESQNGNLKTNCTNQQQQQQQQDDGDNKFKRIECSSSSLSGELDYATDCESTSRLGIKMPCGSRSRRNRRNRQRRRAPRSSTPPNDGSLKNLAEVTEEEPAADDSGNDERNKAEEAAKKERTIDGDTLKITTERSCPEELPYLENMSTARSRLMRHNNRCKIEKKTMNTDTQICEIRTIRNAEPLEARLDHIAGVGIVESSLGSKERSTLESPSVTVIEPVEPVQPLPEDLATKVENLAAAKECWAVAIPSKSPFDSFEIREMTDSEAEFDSSNSNSGNQKAQPQGIISEVESDVEREGILGSEDEGEELPITWEMEKQLRSFIEALKLPSSPAEAASSLSARATDVHSGSGRRDKPRAGRKRATAAALGSYQSQMSQESNRCLGIIQEEGESKCLDGEDERANNSSSSSSEKHIRDFINEEIGKYRRESRDSRSVLRYENCARRIRSAGEERSEGRLMEAESWADKGRHHRREDQISCDKDMQSKEIFKDLVKTLNESLIDESNVNVTVSKNTELSEIRSSVDSERLEQVESNKKERIFTKMQTVVSEKTAGNGKISESEAKLVPERSLEKDVVRVKNRECNNEVDLEEVLIHRVTHPDINNDITKTTNEIVQNDDSNDKNNEDEISNRSSLINNDDHSSINIEEIVDFEELNDNSQKFENRNELLEDIVVEDVNPDESQVSASHYTNEIKDDDSFKCVSVESSISKDVTKKLQNQDKHGDEDVTMKKTEIPEKQKAKDVIPLKIENENILQGNAASDNKSLNETNEQSTIPINLKISTTENETKVNIQKNDLNTAETKSVQTFDNSVLDDLQNEDRRSDCLKKRSEECNVSTKLENASTSKETKITDVLQKVSDNNVKEIEIIAEKKSVQENIDIILKEGQKERNIPIIMETSLLSAKQQTQNKDKKERQSNEKIAASILENENENFTESITETSNEIISKNLQYTENKMLDNQWKERTIPITVETSPTISAGKSDTAETEKQMENQNKEQIVPIQLENKTLNITQNTVKTVNETIVENIESSNIIRENEKQILTEQLNTRNIPIKIETELKNSANLQSYGQYAKENQHKECNIPIKLNNSVKIEAEKATETSEEIITENIKKEENKEEKYIEIQRNQHQERTIPIKIEGTQNTGKMQVQSQRENQSKERNVPIQLEEIIKIEVEKSVETLKETVTEDITKSENNKEKNIEIQRSLHEERMVPIKMETSPNTPKFVQKENQKQTQSNERNIPIKLENTVKNEIEKCIKTSEKIVTENIGKSGNIEQKDITTQNEKHEQVTVSIEKEIQKNKGKEERNVPIQLENVKIETGTENITKSESKKEKDIKNKKSEKSETYVKMQTESERDIASQFQNLDQKEKQGKECKIPITLEDVVKLETEKTVEILKETITESITRSANKGEKNIDIEMEQCKEREVPVQVKASSSSTEKSQTENENQTENEMKVKIVPIKLESTSSSMRKISKETITENRESQTHSEQFKERAVPIKIENQASHTQDHISQVSEQEKREERVIPVKLENATSTAAASKNITINIASNESKENDRFIRKESASLIDSQASGQSIKFSKETECLKREKLTLDDEQVRKRAPEPPKRTTSLRQAPMSEAPVFEFPFFIEERKEAAPAARRRKLLLLHESRYPPDFPFCPEPTSKFAVFHQRALNSFDFDFEEQIETVEFIKSLLSVLSSHESTRQDVQSFLSDYELDKLPGKIRGIIDDLMAPTPSLSSDVSTSSDGYLDLCNEFGEVDKKIVVARFEKESGHSCPRPLVPPRPSAPLVQESIGSGAAKYDVPGREPSGRQEEGGSSAVFNAESPQPIPFYSLDDHLYYVPANFGTDLRADRFAKFDSAEDLPDSLKDLCLKKIFSMPHGDRILSEMLFPKFNIFNGFGAFRDSFKGKVMPAAKQRLQADDVKSPKGIDIPINLNECVTYANKKTQLQEMERQSGKSWTGVPTKDNPKLLVCFSPAQQEAEVKTSVDKLLDLHKKYINRRGYHLEHSHSISPPKYYVDVAPLQAPEAPPKELESSNRLLSIIKENPIPNKKQANHPEERLRATRLSDWLNLARGAPPADKPLWQASGDVLIERRHRAAEGSDKARNARPANGCDVAPQRNATPSPRRSPVSFCNSAAVDKSTGSPLESRRSRIEPWYVNPALIIEDKPELPPKLKKVLTVDRECIDTRSIFDQGPTTTAAATPRTKIMEVTAHEILENLKQLQAEMRDQLDKKRRHSLPQEYFDKQLGYIERLESQLKDAIIAEEEKGHKTRPYSVAESSFAGRIFENGDNFVHKDQRKESSKSVEGDRSNTENKEESREVKQEVKRGNGFFSSERIERTESTKSSRPKLERPLSAAAIPTNGEVFRKQMYEEYVHKVLEREERKQQKLIKISSHAELPARRQPQRGRRKDYSDLNKVEREFIEAAQSRLSKHGIKLDESEAESGGELQQQQQQQQSLEAKFLVDGKEVKDARGLPKHLQEFLELSAHEADDEMIAPKFKASSAKPGVWSPGGDTAKPLKQPSPERGKDVKDEPIPPVWSPSSAGPSPVPERKEFRPVPFESPVLSRKKISPPAAKADTAPPPWKGNESEIIGQAVPPRIVNSYSAPSQGLSALAAAPRLPRAQNPTITLLQKAREGQLPKGAAYLDESKAEEKPLLSPGEIIYTVKKEYESEPESENAPPKKMADLGPRKFEGIGPTTRGGIPIVLRSEVKDSNQAKWYKRMYDSLHRVPKNDDYITIRYKPHRGTRTGYSGASSGYLSEPEPSRNYSDRSATVDNRRHRQRAKENNDYSTFTLPRPAGRLDGHYSPDTYHMNPGRIEDYEPGNCSIQEKETKEPPSDLTWAKRKWWDEVMDIFDGWLDENGRLQKRSEAENCAPMLQRPSSARPSVPSTALAAYLQQQQRQQRHQQRQRQQQQQQQQQQHQHQQSHSVSSRAGSRSLRGPSPLGRLYAGRAPAVCNGKIRRDLELNEEQQRLRHSRLLESLFELAAVGRPRSGSSSESERRIIRPLGGLGLEDDGDDCYWSYLGPAAAPAPDEQRPRAPPPPPPPPGSASSVPAPTATTTTTTLSSSASSSSSVTNSSSNGTTASTNHAAPFEQSRTHSPKSYMTHALKESGYESDSTLVFRRREDASPLSPLEQRIAYKTVQKGGDVPLHGLRKPAPERPKDDTEIEYFPISPTLTRIRVHRKSSCSSATASPASSTSSMNVSRIPVSSMASSTSRRSQTQASRNNSSNPPLLRKNVSNSANPCCVNTKVPSPPKRKSSRNNRTLKLIASSAKSPDNSQSHVARHEQCFVEEQLSNIRLLKEKLNSNLERHRREREESQKQRVLRTSSASPVPLSRRPISGISLDSKKRRSDPCLSRSSCASADTLPSRLKSRLSNSASPVARSPKTPLAKKTTEAKSTISRTVSKSSITDSSRDLRNLEKTCQHVSRSKTTNSILKKERKVSRTKKEQQESCKRLSRSTVDLTSPVEVRRVLQIQKEKDKYPKVITTKVTSSGTLIKSSSAPYTSTLGSSRLKLDEKSLKVTVAISPKGREILSKPSENKKFTSYSKDKHPIRESIDSRKKTIKTVPLQKAESKPSNISDMKPKSRNDARTCESSQMKNKVKVSSRESSKANSLERVKSSERMTKSDINTPALTIDLLRQHHESTMSDSFFQHLFLRDIMLSSTEENPLRRSSVMERARMFQEIGYSDSYRSEPSLKSLSIYLTHKRPVSNSRFKNWERESMSSRSSSPFGLRSSRYKYESLLRVDEFGSSSSLRGRSPDLTRECPKERSLSEPPLKTLRESPDPSRAPSPAPIRAPSTRRIQNLRQDNLDHTSESVFKKSRARSASEVDYVQGYAQNFGSNLSLNRSTNSLVNFPLDHEDYQHYILERLHSRQKSKRYKDLYDFYTSLERMGNLEKTTSSGDLRPRLKNEEIIDYERWKQIRVKEKAEQELKDLYKKLKLVQKEKDFLFSTRDVDRFKWRGDSSLRCKERSVENIREQFRKLESQESELEALRQREIAAKKDTYKPLWRGSSVVNVANTMTRKAAEKADFDRSSIQASLQRSLGGSNKFWSSLSIEQVTALKNQLNDIYGNDPVNPTKKIKTKRLDPPGTSAVIPAKPNGITESQKNHADVVITSEKTCKRDVLISDSEQSSMSVSDYEIVVSKLKRRDASPEDGLGLHVRCHSMIASDRPRRDTDSMKRSGSISRVSSLERSQSDRAPTSSPMSEGEKKRLSLTLGKEMLEKVSEKLTSTMVKPRETRGALAAALAKSASSASPRTCSSIDAPTSLGSSKSKERSDFVLVLTPNEDGPEQKERVERVMKEWSKKPPAVTITPPEREAVDQIDSATESSDTSVRTVVRRSSECDDLQKKVEFYEKIEEQKDKSPRAAKSAGKLSSSQSFADLKELFGESTSARYETLALCRPRSRSASPTGKAEQMVGDGNSRGRSSSASPDVVASTRRPPRSCSRDRDERQRQQQQQQQRPRSVSPYRVASPTDYGGYSSGSLESLWQRCGSPDPEKYWRTYLKLVRDGTVRRLRAKFESLEELSHSHRRSLALLPKRFQSDPELARNLLNKVTDTTKNYIKAQEIPDVAWLRRKYEPARGRRRRGRVSPIGRLPWKLEDLTMPHINVISKTAELKESASRKPASSVPKEERRELEARRPVNRVREMFERSLSPSCKTSILGEMFTSAPNVHELRDIAPYLAGRWVAHQYPSRYDNARSLSSPPDLSRESESSSQRSKRSITPPSRKKRTTSSRASSTSPARARAPGSILKQSSPGKDVFADQPFDPSKHRPRFRYQPPPPPLPLLPAPRIRHRAKPWWPPIPTYSARPTVVTFEGPDTTKACRRLKGV